MTDFLIYDVDGAELTSLIPENVGTDATKNVPQSGFTQRATIDCDKDEIYVLTSLSKEKERRDLNINSFWLFSLAKREWCCVYKSDHSIGENCYLKSQNACPEPCPRYAHQIVYDAARQVHFLFGGNPGMNSHFRLDDFWMLRLEKPTRDNILRYCKYLLRKQEYEEVARADPLAAIRYLQTKLYDIIDHNDPAQLKEFHKLASLLFKSNASTADGESEPTSLLTCSLSGQKHPNEHDPSGDNAKMMRVESPKAADDADASSISSLSSECSQTARAIPSTSAATSPSSSSSTCSSSSRKANELFELKIRRCLLYNKLVDLLPEGLCQPKKNISDFVLL